MKFTYTTDLPNDPDKIKSGYYRLPRSILLPPYLAQNPYFVEYTNSIDQVFDSSVESPLLALQNVRNMWTTSKEAEAKITNGEMLDFAQWAGPDHATVVQQVNLLGMQLSTAELVDEVSYRTLAKFLGSYWYDKGKNSSVDFLNFCLGTELTITPLWTKDYKTFVPYPGDNNEFVYRAGRQPTSAFMPQYSHSKVGGWQVGTMLNGVGQPLNQTGAQSAQTDDPNPWFPTTHVSISVPAGVTLPAPVIGKLFYEICNYNLVLHSISTPLEGRTTANIIATHGATNSAMAIATPYYPLLYHSRVGGHTGGVGSTLTQVSTQIWT